LTVCFLNCFTNFLLMVIFLNEVMNGLLLLSHWLLFQVVASGWNIGHKARVIELEETWPAANRKDVVIRLAVTLGAESVAVVLHEFAIFIIYTFEELFSEVSDTSAHQGLRDGQLQRDL
jgi:hypothetical protein